jgi:hypothetical protein
LLAFEAIPEREASGNHVGQYPHGLGAVSILLAPITDIDTVDEFELPPNRHWRYDGRFIHSRVTGKDGEVAREHQFDASLATWTPTEIKRNGGIRVVIFFQPMGGMVRHNELFDVPVDQAQAITAWLDRHIRRR